MLDHVTIEETLKNLKPLLKKKFSVTKIGYFGSYSRKSAQNNSDLDLLVYLNKPLGWSFFDLKNLLEEKLKIKVDLVSYEALRKELREPIIKETKFVD